MIGEVKVNEGTLLKEFHIGGALCGHGFKSITLDFADLANLMELSMEQKAHWINHIHTRMIP